MLVILKMQELSAWLGLVPQQNSSGGKERLLGISKRGDVYIRMLLIQGARSLLNAKLRYQDNGKKLSRFSEWIFKLLEKKNQNITVVAIANKLARIVFAILTTGKEYNEQRVCT
ncbi:IS110 family transposase domain protein (plasmid) [Candidatus Trichorickettsia mobilis]|nr:IS110 family transposase domain protein [Candidatus Trichorickettsia mobilis]